MKSTVNTVSVCLQHSVSLEITDSTPFSASDCTSEGKLEKQKKADGSLQKKTQLISAASQLRA